jgi:hypothetical protein
MNEPGPEKSLRKLHFAAPKALISTSRMSLLTSMDGSWNSDLHEIPVIQSDTASGLMMFGAEHTRDNAIA